MKVLSSGHGGHGQGDRAEDREEEEAAAEDAREEDEDEGDGGEEEVVAEEVARKASEVGKGTNMRDQQCTLL